MSEPRTFSGAISGRIEVKTASKSFVVVAFALLCAVVTFTIFILKATDESFIENEFERLKVVSCLKSDYDRSFTLFWSNVEFTPTSFNGLPQGIQALVYADELIGEIKDESAKQDVLNSPFFISNGKKVYIYRVANSYFEEREYVSRLIDIRHSALITEYVQTNFHKCEENS